MSLDPHWSSTIYGFYVVGGHVVSAFAFIVLIGLFLAQRPPMNGVFRPVHFHDYGKLMLAFVVSGRTSRPPSSSSCTRGTSPRRSPGTAGVCSAGGSP
jgi:hypothetical protein